MTDTQGIFLHLLRCALRGEAPDDKALEGADLTALLALAKKHSAASLTCFALEATRAFEAAPAEIRKKWSDTKDKAVRRGIMFDYERKALFAEFEKRGIWYMPLKGIIIKDYYPLMGMREMSDNDILFDPSRRKEVREIFKSRGYTGVGDSHGNHDAYKKAPVLCFEMHMELFEAGNYPTLAAKYENVQSILLNDADGSCGRHLSDEDFYVFELAHAYKHYNGNGTGVRTLTDIWVLNQRLGGSLKRDYVDAQLDSLGILSYERESRQLAGKLFGDSADIRLTEAEEKMLDYYLSCGSYGSVKNRVNNRLADLSADESGVTFGMKLRYILKRLFPGRGYCRKSFPFFYKYPVFLPAFWVWRIYTKAFKHQDWHKEEIKALKKAK